jgi:hypothetical protein
MGTPDAHRKLQSYRPAVSLDKLTLEIPSIVKPRHTSGYRVAERETLERAIGE